MTLPLPPGLPLPPDASQADVDALAAWLVAQAPALAGLSRIAASLARGAKLGLVVPVLPPVVLPPVGGLGRCLGTTYAAPTYPVPLRTFYVDALNGNDGNTVSQAQSSSTPWRTVGKFNGAASPGDRGYFRGTFSGTDFVRPAMSGVAANKIVYEQWPGQPLNFRGAQYGVAVWLDGRSHIVLKGIDFSGNVGNPLIQGVGGGGFNWLQGCTLDPLVEGSGANSGVIIRGQPDWRVEDCLIQNIGARSGNAGDGIFVNNGSHRAVVVRNRVGLCGHSAMTLGGVQAAGDATCDDCVVAQNVFRNGWAGDLIVNGKAVRPLVECNDLADAGTNVGGFTPGTIEGLLLQGTGGIYRYNRIWNCAGRAISMETYPFAGFFHPVIGNVVHNNTAVRCGFALQLSASAGANCTALLLNNLIANNLFWQCNQNQSPTSSPYIDINGVARFFIRMTSGSNPWNPVSGLNGNVFRNNRFAATGDTVPNVYFFHLDQPGGPNTNYPTPAAAQAAYSGLLNNQGDEAGDPLFAAPGGATPDLHLQALSTAIDAGFAVPGMDFLGVAPDLGAYESR